MRNLQSIEDIELRGQRVFIRVDFNVPLHDGVITDDTRIRAALPTIQFALGHGAKVIVASHLGRPHLPRDRHSLSMEPVGARLSELIDKEVVLVDDPASEATKGLLTNLTSQQILMLENLRFHPGEEKNSSEFAMKLARFTDVYINDAFGSSHRAHASIYELPKLVRKRAAGFLVLKEVSMLNRLLYHPEPPFVCILGGAKVSDKLGIISQLLDSVDVMIVGGAMALTFLKASGVHVGSSKIETEKLSAALDLIHRMQSRQKKLLLPIDHIIVQNLEESAEIKTTEGADIPDGWLGVDIGPKTRANFASAIGLGRTCFWNGPMGIFETETFAQGSRQVAQALAELPSASITIVGGGDSAAAVNKFSLSEKMTHISTGGGASLEYLQGDSLPGLEVLRS